MSSVRKRTLPSGQTRWQVDYRDRAGTRRHKQFRTKSEAVTYETKVRSEIVAGTHVADSASMTVHEAGELWLARAEREGLEYGTFRQYRQHLQLHIDPLIGSTKLSKLTTPSIEKFRDDLLASRSRPLSRAILTSLKGILKEAKRLGGIGHNPAAETMVGGSRRHKEEVVIPTKDQIRAVLAKSTELWPLTRVEMTRTRQQKIVAVCWRPLIVTAIFSGLRCSELRGLTWPHVDLDCRVIEVRQRADFQNVMGPPKTAAGYRDVPMAPMVANTLKSWKLACPKTPLDLVFPTKNGTIHSNGNIHKRCWGPLLRSLGIVGVDGRTALTLHSLRHAAASLFIEQKMSPKKVQVVMGHSSIQVTFDIYGHLFSTPDDDQQAMAQIEARLLA